MRENSGTQMDGVLVGLSWGLALYVLFTALKFVRLSCGSTVFYLIASWMALLLACYLTGRLLIKKKIAEERDVLIASYGWLLEKNRATEVDLKDLENEKQSLLADLETAYSIKGSDTGKNGAPPVIKSDTVNRLIHAIEAFSANYPESLTKPPKLNEDVRPWLKKAGIAISDREAHVFGSIIAEHFKLLGDTQKT